MNQDQKNKYLKQAKVTLDNKRNSIKSEIERIPEESLKIKEMQNGSATDKLTYQTMIGIYRKRFDDLQNLYPSPYFYSCRVKLDGENDCRELYFAKFSFDAEAICSWASPIAQIRFEAPGKFSFNSNSGKQTGEIIKKDQYLITDGKILFLSTESQDWERELIYQEYFSTRKTAFMLPEIVAQMERAQDQVVRATFGGTLVVTGPAGSGKTTLALHRVAYLLQSPETADKLSDGEVIVFVQDESTKDYFSHLLPELGIKDVEITTLADWAEKILPLAGWFIMEHEKDGDASYIWAKIKGLKAKNNIVWRKDWFNILTDVYSAFFDQKQRSQLIAQRKSKILDRLDLAVLLKSIYAESGGFNIEKEYYTVIKKTQEAKRKKVRCKAFYKLMIIDEFQNYLSQQLDLFNFAINPAGGEIVYIGDFNQRVRLGAVSNLTDIDSRLPLERVVKLSKVYRNTKEILHYLSLIGYEVAIPEMIKSGPGVEEVAMTESEELSYVQNKLSSLSDVSVGILSHDEKLLGVYGREFAKYSNIKIMPLIDAQGVEFDTVFIVGVNDALLSVKNIPEEVHAEVNKIKLDLLYIALTRAMNSLYVLGREKLSLIIRR